MNNLLRNRNINLYSYVKINICLNTLLSNNNNNIFYYHYYNYKILPLNIN